jgi:hypothetical protein
VINLKKVGGSYIFVWSSCYRHKNLIRIYFYCQQQIIEAIICIAIEEVEFLNKSLLLQPVMILIILFCTYFNNFYTT